MNGGLPNITMKFAYTFGNNSNKKTSNPGGENTYDTIFWKCVVPRIELKSSCLSGKNSTT